MNHTSFLPLLLVTALLLSANSLVLALDDNKASIIESTEYELGQDERETWAYQGGQRGQQNRDGNRQGMQGMQGGYGNQQQGGAQQQQGNNNNAFGRSNDMTIIQNLLNNRLNITRVVTESNGIYHAETTSKNPQIANWIQEHVASMMQRVATDQRIRQWDPIFVEMFDKRSEILSKMTNIPGGVEVDLFGVTVCGQSLAEAHVKLVSAFLSGGRPEVQKAHPIPPECD